MKAFINEKENTIKIYPENLDDLFYIKKIINPGDRIFGETERSFKPIGSKKIERKKIKIEIEVEKIEFHKHANLLRAIGKIKLGPEDVKINSYHTLEIKPFQEFIIKKEKITYEKEIIKEAIRLSKTPVIKIVVMDEKFANIATLRQSGIDFEKTIKSGISKLDENYDEKVQKYFSEIMKSLNDEKAIIGGNEIIIDIFKKYLKKKNIKKKFYFEKVTSSEKSGVYEILRRGIVKKILKDEKISEEYEKIETFMRELERLSIYGYDEIKNAIEVGNLSELFITDEEARKNPDLIEKANEKGTKVTIFTSEEEPYKKLKAFGGIAGILRYRM